jgi:hypothetical protein
VAVYVVMACIPPVMACFMPMQTILFIYNNFLTFYEE